MKNRLLLITACLVIYSAAIADSRKIASEILKITKTDESFYNLILKFADDNFNRYAKKSEKKSGVEIPDSLKPKFLECFKNHEIMKGIHNKLVDEYVSIYNEKELQVSLTYNKHKGIDPDDANILVEMEKKKKLLQENIVTNVVLPLENCNAVGITIIQTYADNAIKDLQK